MAAPEPKRAKVGRPRIFREEDREGLLRDALADASLTAVLFKLNIDPVLTYLTTLRDEEGLTHRMIAQRIAKQLKGGIHEWKAYVEARLEAPLVWSLAFVFFSNFLRTRFFSAGRCAAAGCARARAGASASARACAAAAGCARACARAAAAGCSRCWRRRFAQAIPPRAVPRVR
jgi:hypothetical protein